MGGRPIIAFVALALIAAAVLFQFFVVLSGAVNGSPEPHFYFLKADTRGMGSGPSRAPAYTAWTEFAVCAISAGGSQTYNCRDVSAAPPFKPTQNFGGSQGVPESLRGGNYYYLMSRASWAFYIIALFAAVVSLFSGLLALCTRLGSYLAAILAALAMLAQAIAGALMTAWTVQARKAFRASGRSASLGRYSYGFTWAAFAALFLATVLFCLAGAAGGNKRSGGKKSRFGALAEREAQEAGPVVASSMERTTMPKPTSIVDGQREEHVEGGGLDNAVPEGDDWMKCPRQRSC